MHHTKRTNRRSSGARRLRLVLLKRFGWYGIDWDEFSHQGFRCNVLFVRPCHGAQYNTHLPEILRVAQFTKHAMVEIRFDIEDAPPTIGYCNVQPVI